MTQTQLSPVISRGVHSWLLDYEILLFTERTGDLIRLNPSAALIWSCLESGLGRDEIAAELAEAFELSASHAEQDVATALDEWQSLDLLDSLEGPALAPVVEVPEAEVPHDLPEPTSSIPRYAGERYYRMLETVIRVRFADPELCRIADSVFGHLRVEGHQNYGLALDVHQDAGGYFLFRNNRLRAHCLTEQEIAPLLHGEAVSQAYADADCLLAIHAAAVSVGNECLVFPATSGSGKTTLTAALIGSGFTYATDELVLLKHRNYAVQAIAAGLGIKPGSWEILQEFHPHLEQLPTGLRQDDQAVRYLLPQVDVMPDDHAQKYRLRALVFPVYQADSETELKPLSAAEALCLLTDAGADMQGDLSLERVTELVTWIRGVDCYALSYGDLRSAVTRIGELLS